jgi:DNA-binding NtrC family response regulator
METVMAATRGGAFDYIAKPFELERMLETVKRAEASLTAAPDRDEAETEDLPESEMIGSSAGMVAIYKIVSKVAPTDATVLLEGETGTGKELIARMIHRNSARAKEPFVAVDCGSIAPSLLESELFGSMRGAFTGAERDRIGLFEAAATFSWPAARKLPSLKSVWPALARCARSVRAMMNRNGPRVLSMLIAMDSS